MRKASDKQLLKVLTRLKGNQAALEISVRFKGFHIDAQIRATDARTDFGKDAEIEHVAIWYKREDGQSIMPIFIKDGAAVFCMVNGSQGTCADVMNLFFRRSIPLCWGHRYSLFTSRKTMRLICCEAKTTSLRLS